jgi:hypothetical protein
VSFARYQFGISRSDVVVVITILGALLTLLYVALPHDHPHGNTKMFVCKTNMWTCHQALAIYLHMNGDWMPWDEKYGLGPWERLHEEVLKGSPRRFNDFEKAPLLKKNSEAGKGVAYQLDWYTCPRDRYYHLSSPRERPDAKGRTEKSRYVLSYGANWRVMADEVVPPQGDGKAQFKPRKASATKRQADMALFAEVGSETTGGEDNWELRDRNDVSNHTGFEIRHTTGQNVAYMDGHIGYHRCQQSAPPQLGLPPFPRSWVPNWPNWQQKTYPGWTQRGTTP